VYDFEGKVLLVKNYHNAGSGRTTTVLNRFVYDAQGRLVKVFQNNNSALVDQLMVQYEYNEIGQLIDKKLHETEKDAGTFIQSVDYRYSIRGWLESINNAQLSSDGLANDDLGDYFGIEFAYNTPVASLTSPTTVFYDGKMSSSRWKSLGAEVGNERQMSYVYRYDKANRLKGAESKMYGTTGWTEEAGALNEEMTFDENGNILTLKRNARQYQPSSSETSYEKSTIDDLQYSYTSTAGGDFLTKVTDASASPRGFNNGTSGTANDYTYDLRGNLLTDANRGITSNITYNQLNKPSRVQYADGHKVDYVYDVNGNKLTMKSYDASNVLKKTTDYVLGFVYEDGVLDFFPSPEGKVINKEGNLEYQYSIADHLGNTRIVFSSVNPTQSPALATFEDAVADELTFDNIKTSTMYWVSKSAANHTPSGQYVMRMNNSYATGPGKAISVFPGDAVAIEVWSYFEGASGFGGSNQPLNSLITSVAGAFGGVAGGAGESGMIYNAVNSAYTVFGLPANRGDDVPTAHLNYILFDRDYNLLDMGWEPVPSNANMSKQRLSFDAMKIQEAGYMYVYLSYDGLGTNWVYFDDLKITHTQTNVVQYNAYYPFGLVADGSWTRTNYENDRLYNAGSELNRTHGWYELFYRNYDPVIGRFLSIDPMALNNESLTSFQYAANNPLMFNDPKGDTQNPAMPWVGDTGGSSNDGDDTFNSSWIDGLSSDFVGAIYGNGNGGGGTSLSDFFRAIANSSFGGSWVNGVATYFKSDADEAGWALDHLSGLSGVEPWALEKLRDISRGIKRDPRTYAKPPVGRRQQELTQELVDKWFRKSFIDMYYKLLQKGGPAEGDDAREFRIQKLINTANTILYETESGSNLVLGIVEILVYDVDPAQDLKTPAESIYMSPSLNLNMPIFLTPGQQQYGDHSFGFGLLGEPQLRVIVRWQEVKLQ
jgi:RHS repeat-associated protein